MDSSFLANVSEEWLDSLYKAWQQDAASVPEEWRVFFSGFDLGSSAPARSEAGLSESHALKQSAVQSLIHRYRSVGHLMACIDPLSPCKTLAIILFLYYFTSSRSRVRRASSLRGVCVAENDHDPHPS